ncbi:MAG: hypothetical protein NTY19_08550 [Planctomycetota bacterium]|nr:hypothetical protein [Planctomycetota bacterium]
MMPKQEEVLPLGVAMHTRGTKQQDDYHWYFQGGDLRLLERVQPTCRDLLMRVWADCPVFAVFSAHGHIGLVVGNLAVASGGRAKSSEGAARLPAGSMSVRTDEGGRIIDDMLYLEFSIDAQTAVLAALGCLLCGDASGLVRHLFDYAEQSFAEYKATGNVTVRPVQLPKELPEAQPGRPLGCLAAALRTTPTSRARVWAHCVSLAEQGGFTGPMTVLCTADVGQSALGPFAERVCARDERAMVLVDAQGFPDELDIATIAEKKTSQRYLLICLLVSVVLGILAWSYFGRLGGRSGPANLKIEITSPRPGTTVPAGDIEMTGRVSSRYGVEAVLLNGRATDLGSADSAGWRQWTGRITLTEGGTQIVRVELLDQRGNRRTEELVLTVQR